MRMPRIQYPRTLVHTPDGFGFIKIRFRYLFCPLPVHAHPPLCWGQLFFSQLGGSGHCTHTIDTAPKQPRRTLHLAEDLQPYAEYFNFKRRKVQDKDEAALLYQVYIPPVHFLNFFTSQFLRQIDFLLTIARG